MLQKKITWLKKTNVEFGSCRMIKAIVDDLRKRKIKAVETFARKGSPDNPSGPVEFYVKKGFRIHRDGSEFPLMRLELSANPPTGLL